MSGLSGGWAVRRMARGADLYMRQDDIRWNTMGTLAVKQYAISDTIPCTIAQMDKFGIRHRTRSAILHNSSFLGCRIARF